MPDTVIKDQASFVNDFAARLEAKNSAPATPAPTTPTTTPAATDTATSENADEEIASPAASGAESDDTGEETTTEDNGDPASTAPATDVADKGTADAPATAAAEKKDDDDPDDVDDEPETPADEAAQVAEFQGLLKKHGLKTTINDLPADVRPIAKAALDNMQSAFTRAQMENTSFRKERTTFEADRRYREEHPELAITEILAKNPELLEKVNAQLDKLEDPDKKRLFDNDVRDTRKKALDDVAAEVADQDRRVDRANAIEGYTRRACGKLSLPFETVVNAVALALQEKPEGKRDLSDEELDVVISRQARILKRHTTAVVRESKKASIQQRNKDRRTTTPAVRPGSGASTPTPTPAAKPKTQAEFIAHMESKHAR